MTRQADLFLPMCVTVRAGKRPCSTLRGWTRSESEFRPEPGVNRFVHQGRRPFFLKGEQICSPLLATIFSKGVNKFVHPCRRPFFLEVNKFLHFPQLSVVEAAPD